jgi:NADH-quinone oxidoreductase subunit M
VYLLYMVQRIAFGVPSPRELPRLQDVGHREFGTLVPLVVLVFWIGLFPNPLVSRMHASVTKTLETMARARVAPTSHPSAAHGPPVVLTATGESQAGRP